MSSDNLIDKVLSALIKAETANSVSWCLGDSICNRTGKYQRDNGQYIACASGMYCPLNEENKCKIYDFLEITKKRQERPYTLKRSSDSHIKAITE